MEEAEQFGIFATGETLSGPRQLFSRDTIPKASPLPPFLRVVLLGPANQFCAFKYRMNRTTISAANTAKKIFTALYGRSPCTSPVLALTTT